MLCTSLTPSHPTPGTQRFQLSLLPDRFASDFPDEPHVPLQLPPDQAAAFEGHVRPLLDLAEGGSPRVADAALVRAVGKLLALLERDPAQYGLLRGVADYVQCTFAQVSACGGDCL